MHILTRIKFGLFKNTILNTGARIKLKHFDVIDQTLNCVFEYHPNIRDIVKRTFYHYDGKKIFSIEEYNPKSGCGITTTYYQMDGKKIEYINEYKGHRLIKQIKYYSDGKTIDYITDYHPERGYKIKRICYHLDGQIKAIDNYGNE
ncbi:DUF2963 domain-containing protein [Phytoplasma sp.]|uniref:DUF2963 domain-containing protein n=1 Tax=Phytoplasma sp. TaxID=2155 RepID=UPI002B403970|nr:DUF2963 domain-containing protein [Phytoplasma sp.]